MIKFARVRDVKYPVRVSTDLNAGIDFFMPKYNEALREYLLTKNPLFLDLGGKISEDYIELPVGVGLVIPTGMKYKIDDNVALIQFVKSGVGLGRKIDSYSGVGDASYQGELHMHVKNDGNVVQSIFYGDKLTQFVPLYVNMEQIETCDYDYGFFSEATGRGDKGFGEGTGNN